MKELFKKLFGLEPMSEGDREALLLAPIVWLLCAALFAGAVVFGA